MNQQTVIFEGPDMFDVNRQMNVWMRANPDWYPTCIGINNGEKAAAAIAFAKIVALDIAPVGMNYAADSISEVLFDLGMPAHILGFQYIKSAVERLVEDSTLLYNITKKLYPGIAHDFNSTPSRTERAMRHAIHLAWDSGRLTKLNNHWDRQAPSNSEFLATLVEKVSFEKKFGQQ